MWCINVGQKRGRGGSAQKFRRAEQSTADRFAQQKSDHYLLIIIHHDDTMGIKDLGGFLRTTKKQRPHVLGSDDHSILKGALLQ